MQICLGPQNDECDRWHESESPRSREPEPGCETAPTRHPTLDLDARGVHMAVDVDGSTGVEKTDFRVGDDGLVVIDGGQVGGGKRVISIQPDYE